MKTKILKRLLSFVFVVNMLITMPFVVSATPPKTSKKHCHSYSMDSNEKELNLGRMIYNNKMEEYKKKGFEDGVNNVPVNLNIPKGYSKLYEDEYRRGQAIHKENKHRATKSNIDPSFSFGENSLYLDELETKDGTINLKKNVVVNKTYYDKSEEKLEKYDERLEEYKKKGYEDGVNNVLNKPYVPRKYKKAYNDEYERGQKEYRNKIYGDKIDQKSEKYDERLEEYKKKGYGDGVNNVLNKPYVPRKYRKAYNDGYERGQEEYRNKAIGNFGYEDGLKNRVMMDKWTEPYQSVYEREYRKGLAIYIKDNLKNQTIDFKKAAPKTLQQAKKLGEMHGVNNVPYRIGAPEDIQDEYGKAYFLAQRNRLFENGYHAAIKKGNKKTLKKTFIIRQYGYWYNKGFEYGREEHTQQVDKLKKQGYIDGLKKHVRSTSVPKEYEQIYKKEYERGREKYIGDMIAKIRKHRLKIKMKYGKDV